jgi:hypothetical protein
MGKWQKAHKIAFAENIAKHRLDFFLTSINLYSLISTPAMRTTWVIGRRWRTRLLHGLGFGRTICWKSSCNFLFLWITALFLIFSLHSYSSNHNDFLDDMDEGQDLNDIDFDELNKIGEDWENAGRVEPAGIAGNVGEPGPGEDAGVSS